MVIVVPVVRGLPAMLFPIPPLMVPIPATLPLGIQVVAAILRFPAVLAVVMNGFVQSGFGFFHGMLALGAIIGMRYRYCNKPRKRRHHHCRHCGFS